MSTTFLRILAVPKKHTLRSSSSSLATSSTCNHFLRLVDTIARAPILTETIVTSPFELLLQILVLFQFFLFLLRDYYVEETSDIFLWDIFLLSCPSLQCQAFLPPRQICLNFIKSHKIFVFSDSRTGSGVWSYHVLQTRPCINWETLSSPVLVMLLRELRTFSYHICNRFLSLPTHSTCRSHLLLINSEFNAIRSQIYSFSDP